MSGKINFQNPLFQSPYTYLQAAGSDGGDGSVEGVHLRWDFLRALDKHLPKGNLSGSQGQYPSTNGFNKSDDWVKIYRAPYQEDFHVSVDFINSAPSSILETFNERVWEYSNLEPISFNANHKTHVRLEFSDVDAYDVLKQTVNPAQDPSSFLKKYSEVVKIYTVGKLMFRAIFRLNTIAGNPSNPFFHVEAVSSVHHRFDELDENEKYFVSSRRVLSPNDDLEQRTLLAENAQHFRFKAEHYFLERIVLSTYEDCIIGHNGDLKGDYELLGKFNLSLDESEVFVRLEDENSFSIDKNWPKFNDFDDNDSRFRVNVDNYKQRWQDEKGLAFGVQKYLELSPAEPLAIELIPSDDADDQSINMVSYLNMLKLVSLDFHIARMLGLGTIDPYGLKGDYIYVMEYITEVAIESVVPAQITSHLFMSLPTSTEQNRFPMMPILEEIDYGLFLDNGADTPTQLTDENGYAPYADERFVNIRRQHYQYEQGFVQFFSSSEEFQLAAQTQPVAFGVEYKNVDEVDFRIPEINHDKEFLDHTGIPETVFMPNLGPGLVMNHRETEEGQHAYALYSINWFSRASRISNIQETDETIFPKRNTILPPANLAVQLIQNESPLIFTTQFEQNKLNNIQSADKTLLRVTFDWNYMHHRAYQNAHYAQYLFNANLPLVIRGKVASVVVLDNNLVQLNTENLIYESTNPITTIQPFLEQGNEARFIGSSLVAGENAFIVQSVICSQNGINPTFVVKKVKQTSTHEFNNDNVFTVSETFLSPETNVPFMVIENMSDENNWDSKLSKKTYLEPFYDNHVVSIIDSDFNANNKKYSVIDAAEQNGTTLLYVRENIPYPNAPIAGEILYNKRYAVVQIDSTLNTLFILGDVTSEILSNANLSLLGMPDLDGNYTVQSTIFNAPHTELVLNQSLNAVPLETRTNLFLEKTIQIAALDGDNRIITVNEEILAELNLPYFEYEDNNPNTEYKILVGGIVENASITEIEDKDENGNTIPNSRTGVYEIEFDNFQLDPHIDSDVDWYKGVVRILENDAYLPNDLEPNRINPIFKKLDVWQIDNSGSSLKIIAFDPLIRIDGNYNPIEGYTPIQTGVSVQVNFHPSYRVYLTEDSQNNNNFNKDVILPIVNEGGKQTLFGICASDVLTVNQLSSAIPAPAIVLAQEIQEPLAPGIPTGPSFATRPNFFGKSTYTFDVQIDTTDGRSPHSLVFYRANEQSILDQLYKHETVVQILEDLANLEEDDKAFFADRWSDLMNLNLDGNGLFKQYVTDGFRFPNPDNDLYKVPQMDFGATPITPFATAPDPVQVVEEIKSALSEVFLSLTEQPVIYNFINEGYQTRAEKPKLRDNDGQLLDFASSEFDPCPMCVKYENNGNQFVRFTDYTLDGASINFYFYCGVEMSNQMKISEKSPVSGPILLINSAAPEQPTVRKSTIRIAVPVLQITDAVCFEINDYVASDNITRVDIYRANNHADALSIRTMDLVKSVEYGAEIMDDFEDDDFPLYGDALFYRVIANRQILNEAGEIEYVPSKPSEIVLTNIVDSKNPTAPEIAFAAETQTTTELENVVLTWNSTCYNGTYRLQKMNKFGNWVQIFETKSNNAQIQYPPLIEGTTEPDFANFDATALLPLIDEDGDHLYHRYRVQVENSSGLFNLNEKDMVVGV